MRDEGPPPKIFRVTMRAKIDVEIEAVNRQDAILYMTAGISDVLADLDVAGARVELDGKAIEIGEPKKGSKARRAPRKLKRG